MPDAIADGTVMVESDAPNPMIIPAAEAARARDVPAFARLLFGLAARLNEGVIDFEAPDGRIFRFGGRNPGPSTKIVLKNWRPLRRVIWGGNVGWAESYVDGEWDSPDVAAFLDLVSRNTDHLREVFRASLLPRIANRLGHVLRLNSRRGAKRNIHAHYDLGNAFYARWLDPTMTYSAARFAAPGEDLSDAQRNKYRALADMIALRPDQTLLEIGCGWGGFAEYAARERGARVTGITISREQHDFAKRRMFEAGLAERADIRLVDYRDVEGQFDRIASIEMFEAVGERYWPAYFAKIHESLKSGGAAGLQVITIADRHFPIYRRSVDFIQKYVFPGGMLPSPSVLRQQMAQAGLEWREAVAFGPDYARTLAEWRVRFLAAWDDIRRMGFDERFRRLWTYYLSYCEAGFRSGSTDVLQVAAVRT